MGNTDTKQNNEAVIQAEEDETENGRFIQCTDKVTALTHGHHETEICYGGEADLQKHAQFCEKNPGHKDFIPIHHFKLSYLPLRFRNSLVMEAIQTLAALTVMVKVTFTSPMRPHFYRSDGTDYPFSGYRGRSVFRSGTGRICSVHKYNDREHIACTCMKCQGSSSPSSVWWEVVVLTATHVVFDDLEAKQTRCVVYFNDNTTSVVNLDGMGVVWADVEKDRCRMTCVTCDADLVSEIDRMCTSFDNLRRQVAFKYRKSVDFDRLTVIVSHPHGAPKQVSLGRWVSKRVQGLYTQYTYTTSTCPGSSGATVYRPGYDGGLLSHPHSGAGPEGNYSGMEMTF